MALNIDIAPTILSLARVAKPRSMQGVSLIPLIWNEPMGFRTEWFYEHLYGHKGRIPRTEGVRTQRWKSVRYLDTEPPFEQLFDLETDPHEQHNLAGDVDQARRLDTMEEKWEYLRRRAE
jgi:arylsulfatase A-like enzyme